jgi:preprotein translocase subunit SecE
VVIKIKATEKVPKIVTKEIKPAKEKKDKKGFLRLLSKIGGYFKGAWIELKQVRWPNRKETWGLTAAVLLFSAFFVVLIVLLDDGFKELFKLIIK